MKQSKTSWAAIIVAALTAIGTIGKSWLDSIDKDNTETIVAVQIAKNEMRWEHAAEDLSDQNSQLTDLFADINAIKIQIASLQESVRHLSHGQRRTAREALEDPPSPISGASPRVLHLKPKAEPSQENVEKLKESLF